MKHITIYGAKEHNLKNINLKIPKNSLAVITGLSGSGKSSLAFDTIYAEGQRRYVESLSAYARQFLEQLDKPQVEHIEGLSPAIAIEQRSSSASPRSVVGTQTEVYDYLRLLFARTGVPYCPHCGIPIKRQTSQQIINKVMAFEEGDKIFVLAPVVRGKKGVYQALFERLAREGFSRVRVDGKIYELEEDIKLNRYQAHNIEIVVDRVIVGKKNKTRIANSIETAIKYAEGLVVVSNITKKKEFIFNTKFACSKCGFSLGELEPRIFSFNSPYGACPACKGLGTKLEFDEDLVVPDKEKTLRQGAIEPWRRGNRGYIMYYRALLRELANELGISLDTPFKKLPARVRNIILYGGNIYVWSKPFGGVIPLLEKLFNTTDSDYLKSELAKYMSKLPCPACAGKRLKKESLAVYVSGKSIWDIMQMPISAAYDFFNTLVFPPDLEIIARNIIKEIKKKLDFCRQVGLGYLTLDRLSATLSGGEAQRIKLATQVGSALSGVIYILDEPTIGLHPRDDGRLIKILKRLKDLDNTVIVVEHDEQMIKNSDWLIDLGPGAGRLGGKVVYEGPAKEITKANTLTAKYLTGKEKIDIPLRKDYRRAPFIVIEGASCHNLKNIDVKIPLGVFSCVTGVSGSGKSTLVYDILYKALAKHLYDANIKPGEHKRIKNINLIDKVVVVDQSPIGRTPRSNPATYTAVYSYIRDVFSKTQQAKERGYKPGRFSFNIPGGRCEACKGEGVKKIEMHFLPDVFVTCEVCKGKRFNEQTLEVKFKGRNISDVLNMSVDEAKILFQNIPSINNILQILQDVGLGYIKLGQSSTTLSGGEAQRIKLASQLRKKATGNTIYILDEPTTGLHFDDIKKLLGVLLRLRDKGNTVIVIEHNLDVIKCADYIIDLGPEGGSNGGYLVACGSPQELVKSPSSYTAKFLKGKLK